MEEIISSDLLMSQSALAFYRDRLSASDMLQVRKVMEHVYEKIINLDNESQTTSSSNNEKPGEQEKEEDIAVLAEEKIELLCQDQVSGLEDTAPFFPVLVLRISSCGRIVVSKSVAFAGLLLLGALGLSHLFVRPLLKGSIAHPKASIYPWGSFQERDMET